MPARVHALLVVRADGASGSAADRAASHLEATLDAVRAQERAIDALTIVICGPRRGRIDELVAASGAEGVIAAPRGTSFAAALKLGAVRAGAADTLWLLAQDTAPDAAALAHLVGALESQPSVSVVAPKLVDSDDPERIVSLGVTMTHLGRTVGLVDGQLDQGQHDADEDVLAADVRGMLVRREAWNALGGLDRALLGADEGLDLGVRARLAGGRVALVPSARVLVSGDGVAGLPAPTSGRRRRRRAYAIRTAQLHRRLAYAHPVAVPFLWLAILPLALLRTFAHIVAKAPGQVLPEWGASVTAWARFPSVAQSRARIRSASRATGVRVPLAQLAPLRVSRRDLAQRFDGPEDGDVAVAVRRGELRFFSGGGAWMVMGALVVGVAAFVTLLAFPLLGGGGLLPLRDTVGALWADVAFGRRALGLDLIGPADPFAAVIAVVGSLTPWSPSQSLVILWVLALPLAALGGWFASTRITDRSGVRIVGGVVWALAPTFLTSLMQGLPAPVIAHLLLPWLFFAGSVARRSWGAAGAASLLFAAVVASAPSLGPALLILWIVSVLTAGRGALRAVWIPVPALVLFAPLIWERGVRAGDWWSVLADPGVVGAASQVTADGAGRLTLVSGFPSADLAGWASLLPAPVAVWIPLALAPLAVLALLSLLTPRWGTALALIGIALLGIGTAVVAAALAIQISGADVSALWPGAGLSLAWLGVGGAALVALDVPLARAVRGVRPWAAALAVVGVIAVSVPALTASVRGVTVLTSGPSSTLPAYVAATGRGEAGEGSADAATIVVAPLSDGSFSSRIVWGASETLGAQTTILSTRTAPTEGDEAVAALTADLVVSSAADVEADLAADGIGFVLLAPTENTISAAATARRVEAVAALNARAGLQRVGDTAQGTLWRVFPELAEPEALTAGQRATARTLMLAQLIAVGFALLLSVPTAASRRAARRYPRIVGLGSGAGLASASLAASDSPGGYDEPLADLGDETSDALVAEPGEEPIELPSTGDEDAVDDASAPTDQPVPAPEPEEDR